MSHAELKSSRGQNVPLLGIDVRAEVLGGHTHVRVLQRYKNAESVPVEAIYTFPLPSDAVLCGFAMICEGRRLEGVVQAREEAFRNYDEALAQGHGAALLEQERPNVFTASVGSLLPNEETLIEVRYLQRLTVDEGALRWMLPTLVAPRYIPGTPTGDRTGGGWSDPTDQVPDADRITPRIGDVQYGLRLRLTFALEARLEITSPSHAIVVTQESGHTQVRLTQQEVALDRDIVIVARNAGTGSIAGVAAHREGDGPGFFALTVVPDLFEPGRRAAPQQVVFVVDTSGSMDGASLPEAKAALKLCLRHLREGDEFDIIEFNSTHKLFARSLQRFSQEALNRADTWIQALRATGGTEMLQPMVEATKLAPQGVVVLLTDGQVGSEEQILRAVLEARKTTRVYSFGIGTNVSDALLRDLGRQTGGSVEQIHPCERIDEKVTATFAKAIAPRVSDLEARFVGVETGELAPAPLPALIDGDPWTVFGRYPVAATGRVELRGRLDDRPFSLDVPVALPAQSSAPAIRSLWAAERIRDLQAAPVGTRRAETMKERITKLSTEFGVSSPYTSFLVVEKREGARLSARQPEARFIPVHTPAGWSMFQHTDVDGAPLAGGRGLSRIVPVQAAAVAPSMFAGAVRGRAVSGSAGAPPRPLASRMSLIGGLFRKGTPPAPSAPADDFDEHLSMDREETLGASVATDPIVELLGHQLASGLWGDGSNQVLSLRHTTKALLELLRAGVGTSHPTHGAQVRKAIDALVPLAQALADREPALVQVALSVAWLLASGRRTRQSITDAVQGCAALGALSVQLSDETALRATVEQASV